MATVEILGEIDAEIARLEHVKELLSNERGIQLGNLAVKESAGRKKRTLSPEARKKIAEAQCKRWATQRRAATKTP